MIEGENAILLLQFICRGHLLQKASINSMAHWSRVCFWWSLWMRGRSSKIGRIQQCDGPCPTAFTTLLCSFSISRKTTHLKVEIVSCLSLRIGPKTRAVRRALPPGFNQPHTDERAMHRNEVSHSTHPSISYEPSLSSSIKRGVHPLSRVS